MSLEPERAKVQRGVVRRESGREVLLNFIFSLKNACFNTSSEVRKERYTEIL